MPFAALAPGASIAAVAGRPAPHPPRASTLGRVAPLRARARVVVAAGLPPFQSDAEQDVDDMTALLGVTYDYPSVQPPPPLRRLPRSNSTPHPLALRLRPRHAPWRGCERGRGRGRVLLCDVSWIRQGARSL